MGICRMLNHVFSVSEESIGIGLLTRLVSKKLKPKLPLNIKILNI